MRLKRLVVQGFKSFKDRTTIHFDDGITGIVGRMDVVNQILLTHFSGLWVSSQQNICVEIQ